MLFTIVQRLLHAWTSGRYRSDMSLRIAVSFSDRRDWVRRGDDAARGDYMVQVRSTTGSARRVTPRRNRRALGVNEHAPETRAATREEAVID
jgi:hypothetical protein